MFQKIESDEGNYEIVGRGDTLPEHFKDEYWKRVERA
jgi:hypothetical protein